jgi:hypothetical protein
MPLAHVAKTGRILADHPSCARELLFACGAVGSLNDKVDSLPDEVGHRSAGSVRCRPQFGLLFFGQLDLRPHHDIMLAISALC